VNIRYLISQLQKIIFEHFLPEEIIFGVNTSDEFGPQPNEKTEYKIFNQSATENYL